MGDYCKSCHAALMPQAKFCANCGGKIVNERLTLGGIWKEFVGPFFSWENNFWKTIKSLILKPEWVLNAYIEGARRKFFRPFPFLIVYTTISLLMLKFNPVLLEKSFNRGIKINNPNRSEESLQASQEFAKNFADIFYGYYNFIIIGMIPILGLISYWIFKKYKNNLAEHIVYQSYIQAFVGYVGILIQILFMNLLGVNIVVIGVLSTCISLFYYNYAFYKLYRYGFWKGVLINLKALFAFGIVFILSALAIGIFVAVNLAQ
ncbi:MAG: DUF3667 domain-containing protein [Flavobacteriales bacterium]|jgi:hypothetical protein|nr:DUF3667 domain-containing protein [Flavobacteriales bacterium]